MGPARKIRCKDDFLLVLMRLQLGLGEKDLADPFKTSLSLTSNIIRSWLRGTANALGKFVFVPDQEVLNDTKPPHFNPAKNLHLVTDAIELFIEMPKGHKNQRLTWSNYKHHNTMKILVAVAPNSSIIFVSKAYSSGKRGQSQMLPKAVKKTNSVAKMRILVEQVF